MLGDHRGQHAAVGTDQVARRHRGTADAAGDRRLDLGVGEIDLGVAQRRLGLGESGLGLELLGQPLVGGDLRAGLGRQELLGALQLHVGVGQGGLGGGALGLALVDDGLVGRGVDLEQDLAFLDGVAVVEFAGAEEAGDAGAQLDLVDGLRASDELALRRERTHFSGLNQDGGRRRLLGTSGAAGQGE